MIRRCVAAALAALAGPALAASDPYDSPKAMDGHWLATTSGGRTQTIDNQCVRTGLFFVCEQAPWAASPRGLACSFQRPPKGANWSFTPRPWIRPRIAQVPGMS